MVKVLLLIDDDPLLLQLLKYQLRDDGYRIHMATCAREGLEIIENHPVHVIMTDQDMPEMTGIELLARIRDSHPEIVRMVLTGNADLEAVTQAINEGAVYKFLIKPWDPDILRKTLREAFQHHALLMKKEEFIQDISKTNEQLNTVKRTLEETIAEKSQQLAQISQYDAITELPNRLLFNDRLKQGLVRSQRNARNAAVLLAGLDRFMLVNETFGHPLGDRLLRAVGERFVDCLRKSDTVARFSGDVFALILTDLITEQKLIDVVSRIKDAFSCPFRVDGHEIHVSASIGISIYPLDGAAAEDLVKHANTAMHHANEKGGDCHQYFMQEMNERATRRLMMENELRHALERDEFVLYYQPKVDAASQSIIGAEALLRWRHRELGLVSPQEFIPVLEESGLIMAAGEWVIHTACRQAREWQECGAGSFNIAVNVSSRQFYNLDISRLLEIIGGSGLEPCHLELEITESILMLDDQESMDKLEALHKLGIKLAIDDFGTGYSSLSYLKRFPVNTLKIDRSFIIDVTHSQDDAAIAKAIIALAHSLKLKVVAEGVETREQFDFLRAEHCDIIQGYLFGKPLPVEEFTGRLVRDEMPQTHPIHMDIMPV